MSLPRVIGSICVASAVLSGCTAMDVPSVSPGSATSTESAGAQTPGKVFVGTDSEWVAAKMACVERHGLAVIPGDVNDSPSFGVSAEGVGQARVDEVLAACDEEVGMPSYSPPTLESQRILYEWRRGQHRCLLDSGFAMPEPPSFDAGLSQDGYLVWDPIADVPDSDYGRALAACPRSTEEWPSR